MTQRGTVANLIRGGLASSGVGELLREARACKRNEYDMTLLIRAAEGNDVELVRQLFRLGCPTINAQTAWGWTALHFACRDGLEAVVRELLAQGADVNVKARDHFTPLMMASYNDNLGVVRLLCDVPGVDLSARGSERKWTRTALGWALHCKQADVAAFLRSRGAPE